MYICICSAVTERQVLHAVADGATTLEDLQIDLGVAMSCGRCTGTAMKYVSGAREAEHISGIAIGAVVEEAANDAVVSRTMVVEVVYRRASA